MGRVIFGGGPERHNLDVAATARSRTERSRSGRGRSGPASRTRTTAYRELRHRLDTGAVSEAGELERLIAAISTELGEAGLPGLPLGLVAECFLGPPYRVHMLDLAGRILTHFEAERGMPPPFESARGLALHADYELVEVYDDHLVAITVDGSAVRVG